MLLKKSTRQIGLLKTELPYYAIPAIKTGIVFGAIIAVIESKWDIIIHIVVRNYSPNSYINGYTIRASIEILITLVGIFNGVRRARKSPRIIKFSFLHAFLSGCIVTLLITCMNEFNAAFNIITYLGQFSRKRMLVFSLSKYVFPYLIRGVLFPFILSFFLKSRDNKEINKSVSDIQNF